MAMGFGPEGCGSDIQHRVEATACHEQRCVRIGGRGEHQVLERLGRSPHMKQPSVPTAERQSLGKSWSQFGREGVVD